MSVQKFLDKIKNGRYGADITDAIIGGIKKCYDDASVNHDNANMEVKMARGTHNTLNDRLDKSDEIQAQTNAQLLQTRQELNYQMERTVNQTTNDLVLENQGISPLNMTFDILSSYRNRKLEPTWSIYKRNFIEEPLCNPIPRFTDTIYELGSSDNFEVSDINLYSSSNIEKGGLQYLVNTTYESMKKTDDRMTRFIETVEALPDATYHFELSQGLNISIREYNSDGLALIDSGWKHNKTKYTHKTSKNTKYIEVLFNNTLDIVANTTIKIGVKSMEKTNKGLKITNFKDERLACYFTLPCKPLSPNFLFNVKVSEYTDSHRVCVGLIKDNNNFVMLSNQADSKYQSAIAIKSNGSASNKVTNQYIETNDEPYTETLLVANNGYSAYIATNEGVNFIGQTTDSSLKLTHEETFKKYTPAFGVVLKKGESVTIESIDIGYYEGFGQADIKSITYEDGEPVTYNGKHYFSVSSRFMGINGGSGYITIYSFDKNTYKFEPVSMVVCKNNGYYEAETSGKFVFDRTNKEWILVTRAFPSPGGSLMIGKVKENILKGGLFVFTMSSMSGVVSSSLDADLIKMDSKWYLCYHGGTPTRLLRVATSTDLINWTEISAKASGEGIAITKTNGQYYILDARTSTTIGVSTFKTNGEIELIGTINLNPNPGLNNKTTGWPWGTIFPIWNGCKTEFYFIVFSRDEYIDMGDLNDFSYGDIWCYKARETENKPEFNLKNNIFLGF